MSGALTAITAMTMKPMKWITIVLDLIMLVIVLAGAYLHETFSPFVVGCWVMIALISHLKELNDETDQTDD